MSVTPITLVSQEERAQALISMGFTTTQALLLAATLDRGGHVDLERLRWMLEAGCGHELAMRILL